jgi:hypothetical protein
MKRSSDKNRLSPDGFDLALFLNEEPKYREERGDWLEVLKVLDLCLLLRDCKNLARAEEVNSQINTVLRNFDFELYVHGLGPKVMWISAKGPAGGHLKQILNMAEAGTLSLVRRCICGQWFFAATNKKLVCSDACRFRKFKQDHQQSFNENRAKYMRTYRKTVVKRRNNRAKTK